MEKLPSPIVSLSPGCWLSREEGVEETRPAVRQRSEYDTVRAEEEEGEEDEWVAYVAVARIRVAARNSDA